MIETLVKFIHWWGIICAIVFASAGIIAYIGWMMGFHLIISNVFLYFVGMSFMFALISFERWGKQL